MPVVRINEITIQGFRSFGRGAQPLNLSAPIAAIHGSNSQGKTSLAEAFEFLLTGQIVRRQLMASSQDEFADALRNAHLPAGDPVFVEACLVGSDGIEHTLRRTLVSDYGKGQQQDCRTTLHIDGQLAAEAELAGLGVVLSRPPLRAPVLAQHTLGYLFSARPQERADYFRTLLEVTDLEELRATIVSLESEFSPQAGPHWTKLNTAITVPELATMLLPLVTGTPTIATLNTTLDTGATALIEANNLPVPATPPARVAAVADILTDRRAKTFPVAAFNRTERPAWTKPAETEWGSLRTYIDERARVDDETRRLTALFKEALNLPLVVNATTAIDCPLCTTPGGLTLAQIAHIRARVAETESYRDAEALATKTIEGLVASAQALENVVTAASPRFFRATPAERREMGFRVSRVRDLAVGDSAALVVTWTKQLRPLARRRRRLLRSVKSLKDTLAAINLETMQDATALIGLFDTCAAELGAFDAACDAYAAADTPLREHLSLVIDEASNSSGWQEFLDLAVDQTGLRNALIERAARTAVGREITRALSAIRRGNEEVLEDKFAALSEGIGDWWDLLRPGEPTFFSGVKPRPGATRTIDFKAGLAPGDDRTGAKVRDVIAVFSQSQLHCLGLALFLARALREGATFIVLDDPILSSDEDYRAFFNTSVIEQLLTRGIQIIVLTQDEKTWRDLENRYLHLGPGVFEMTIENPVEGTVVLNTSDDLIVLLERGRTLSRNKHRDLRKQAGVFLRDAGERFCKEMLVKDRKLAGDQAASITDYDQNLGQLTPRVEPFLVNDPAHPGKLRAIGSALNPANHDDGAPGQSVLKVSFGDLRALTKEYLGR